MSALDELFARTRAEGRSALIGYLPAGFPSVDLAAQAMCAMVDAGVDAIEIGLPYSDPLLDGPTIQAASSFALAQGVNTRDVFDTVTTVAKTGAPTLVMTYWNPVEQYGLTRFADDLMAAGGAGTITADITPDVATSWVSATTERDLDHVFLIAPSSTDERIRLTTAACTGFVYAAAVMGVTGARATVSDAAEHLVRRARAVTTKPVCVGLGVSTAEQAANVARFADGVIVGSAFVQRLLTARDQGAEDHGVSSVAELARELAAGVRSTRQEVTT